MNLFYPRLFLHENDKYSATPAVLCTAAIMDTENVFLILGPR